MFMSWVQTFLRGFSCLRTDSFRCLMVHEVFLNDKKISLMMIFCLMNKFYDWLRTDWLFLKNFCLFWNFTALARIEAEILLWGFCPQKIEEESRK